MRNNRSGVQPQGLSLKLAANRRYSGKLVQHCADLASAILPVLEAAAAKEVSGSKPVIIQATNNSGQNGADSFLTILCFLAPAPSWL